jgi:phosphatidylinositol alpha-1,6-mannosyltransferase
MRVLFVSHSLPLPGLPTSNLGGMQRMAVELEATLREHPEVRLSSRVLQSSWRWTGLRTAPFLGGLLLHLPRIVREEGIEVVLFSSMVTAASAVPLRRRLAGTGALLAATPVGRDVTLPNPAYQRLIPHIFRALDLVLPISRATGEECLARGLSPARMRVVPVGIDVTRFPPVEDRAAARGRLLAALREAGHAPVPDGALLLCSVGRHQERKGFHWFIEEVIPHLPPGAVYLLAGGGPMTPVIREAVERAGLQQRVRLLGRVSEELLTLLYRGSDLFVMPNIPVPGDIEGFGVVMLEAGLGGLPVLAADLEGIRDVVHPGESGVLLPPRGAAAFVDAVKRFRDPAALAAAATAARASVIARFAWPAVADQYVQAFRSALTPASPAGAAPEERFAT